MNAALIVYKELRIRDSFDVLNDYFSDDLTGVHDTVVHKLYNSRRATLENLAAAEPVSGDNPKLHKLCDLLSDLFSTDTDPRGRATCIATYRCIVDARFDSRPDRCRVKTLGKFLTPSCNVVLYSII